MAGNVWEWLNARYCEIGPDPPKNFSCILTAYDAILDGRPVAVLHAGQLQDPAHGRRPHALTLTGRSPHENRVLVGGSFMTPSADILRVAYRHEDPPDLRMRCLGFRVAL
jgi:formylglycine-generating enzyme required for sulfatase activity